MHDEDWVIFDATVPYSNTLSSPVTGDLGLRHDSTSAIRCSAARAPMSAASSATTISGRTSQAFGCTQIANSNSDCVPALPSSVLGITEDDKWNSLRIGVNGVVKLMDRLTLDRRRRLSAVRVVSRLRQSSAAHRRRATPSPPRPAPGAGVQLEAILSYAIGKSFSVGAGGRYWAMWATGIYRYFQSRRVRARHCRFAPSAYGAFVQASYKLDGLK